MKEIINGNKSCFYSFLLCEDDKFALLESEVKTLFFLFIQLGYEVRKSLVVFLAQSLPNPFVLVILVEVVVNLVFVSFSQLLDCQLKLGEFVCEDCVFRFEVVDAAMQNQRASLFGSPCDLGPNHFQWHLFHETF